MALHTRIFAYILVQNVLKSMYNWGNQTHDLAHTFALSNHYAASVNISVLLLYLTTIICKNHCTARLRHIMMAAGVGHPVRASQCPPHLPGHLALRALTQKSWSCQWQQRLRHGGTHVVQVLKLPWLAVAPDCTRVEKHSQAAAGQLAGRSAINTFEGGHSGLATASGTGTVIVARAINACGTGQCHASSDSDCWARKRKA